MCELWINWMLNGDKELTKAGNLRCSNIGAVRTWVSKGWDMIPPSMVVKSSLKCGISNNMDGTEDDELFSEFLSSDNEDSAHNSIEVHNDVCFYDDGLSDE